MIQKCHKLGALAVILCLLTACPNQGAAKKLAVASNAVAHALVNAQTAADQARMKGLISQDDEDRFNAYLVKVSQAGLVLDQGIRANESAAGISAKVGIFLDAFNQLQNTGVLELHNQDLQIAIVTIITGAETSIAIIAATVGGK